VNDGLERTLNKMVVAFVDGPRKTTTNLGMRRRFILGCDAV
jgi:hypothetical protein